METLLDVLTQYAEENLVARLLREKTPQIRAAQLQAELTAKKLRDLGPDVAEQVEKLEIELDNVHFCREQAFLLSGISIGLRLGQL